jgi:outer membrane protein TolC
MMDRALRIAVISWALCILSWSAPAQQTNAPTAVQVQTTADSQAPVVITLQDALQRARNLDPTYRAALLAAGIAREEHVQARAALLPGVTENTQYLYTQGTGTSLPRLPLRFGSDQQIAYR